MREREYRAWHKTNKQWIDGFMELSLLAGLSMLFNHVTDIEITEYIGRKDKNDKKIFERDRVNIGRDEPGWIIYDHTKSAWIVQSYAYWCYVYEVDEIEIIGNVYEHPERAKKEQ
jgi:YopX protein